MYTTHSNGEYRIMRALTFLKKKNKIIRWKKCVTSFTQDTRYRITLLNGQLLQAFLVYSPVDSVTILYSNAYCLKICLPHFFSIREFVLLFLSESQHRCKGTTNEQKIKELLLNKKLQLPNASIFQVTKTKKKDDINGVDFFITVHTQPNTLVTIPLQVKSSKKAQEEHKKSFPLIPSIVYTHNDSALEKSLTSILVAYTNEISTILHL